MDDYYERIGIVFLFIYLLNVIIFMSRVSKYLAYLFYINEIFFRFLVTANMLNDIKQIFVYAHVKYFKSLIFFVYIFI